MDKIKAIVLCFLLMGSCQKSIKEDVKKDLNGLWYDKKEEVFFVFNDSLCLANVFYPYVKWKIFEDSLYINDLGGTSLKDSLWMSFSFRLISDSLFISDRFDNYKLSKVKDENKFAADLITLNVSSCISEDICQELDIKILLSTGQTEIVNLEENTSKIMECFLSKEGLQILNTLLVQAEREKLDDMYISNFMHAKYFTLQVYIGDNEVRKVVIDSGGAAPKYLEMLVSYIWATSKLKCNPENYYESLKFD